MNKIRIGIIAAVLIIIIIVVYQGFRSPVSDTDLIVQPQFGQFQVTVTTTGELQAKNSTDIRGPQNARLARIWNMKITDLVPEGTIVASGDYVGELDKSELTNNIQESQINLQKLESQLVQAQLDSSLALSQARNELINLGYALEQRQLTFDQSQFEAPAVQRQAEIELEKSQRALEQARKNYQTKVQQSIEKIKVVEADLTKQQQRHSTYEEILQEFTIKAPENGMVIYAKEWDGKKKIVGSTISTWDPVVATLPDLSVMESVTYINEVDIQKIQNGQVVEITLDADPDKTLTGTVTEVANIGEQRPNSDSKVFEVKIEISESDTTLRPSMTTGNIINVAEQDSVLFIPLECIFADDTTTVVLKKAGRKIIKQQVVRGLVNDNYAIIEAGLKPKDRLVLNKPEDFIDLPIHSVDN